MSKNCLDKVIFKDILKLFLILLIPFLLSLVIFCIWFKKQYPQTHIPGEGIYNQFKKERTRLTCPSATHTFCEGRYGFYQCLKNCGGGETYDYRSKLCGSNGPSGLELDCDVFFIDFNDCNVQPCYCLTGWKEEYKYSGKFFCED